MKNHNLQHSIKNHIFIGSNAFTIVGIISYLILVNQLFSILTNDQLLPLLYPVTILVQQVIGLPFEYYSEYGFVQSDGLVRINQSCSGFIYLNVLFCIGYLASRSTKELTFSKLPQIALIPLLGTFAYLTCILCNSSRIILGIKMHIYSQTHSWFPNHFLHEVFGIVYFVIFSSLFYLLIQKFLRSWNN